jgi:hypothetical protein
MATHPIEEFRRRDVLTRGMRFVLVNQRSPRTDASCATCCTRIGRGYVRDPQTRLLYCDAQCFADHERMDNPARQRDARRVS